MKNHGTSIELTTLSQGKLGEVKQVTFFTKRISFFFFNFSIKKKYLRRFLPQSTKYELQKLHHLYCRRFSKFYLCKIFDVYKLDLINFNELFIFIKRE